MEYDLKHKLDKGVRFVNENIQKGIAVARKNQSLSFLEKVLRREAIRLASVTKTGDLVRYFRRFSSHTHRHASEFALLAKASGGCFIPSEELAEYLVEHFPEESKNETKIHDFKFGEVYQNDYLSVIFGGNYARSFRFSRDFGVTYLVINGYNESNAWEDGGNTLLYQPYDRYQKGLETSKRLHERYRNYKTLVFQKEERNEIVFLGELFLEEIESNTGKLVFKRDPVLPPQNDYAFWQANKAPDLNDVLPKTVNLVDAVSSALVESAEDNGVEFTLHPLGQIDMSQAMLFHFPHGFYELFGTYDAFLVLILHDNHLAQVVQARRDMLSETFPSAAKLFAIDCSKYEADQRGKTFRRFGWRLLEDKINEMVKMGSPFQKGEVLLRRPRPTEPQINPVDGKSRIAIYRFLIDAIMEDYLSENEAKDPQDATAEKRLKSQSGGTLVFDLVLGGYYGRLGMESPIVEIKFGLSAHVLRDFLNRASEFGQKRIVFVDITGEKAFKKTVGDCEYLVLGRAFIAQLARLYPSIYYQYVLFSPRTALKDGSSSRRSSLGSVAAAIAIDSNRRQFKDLVLNSEQPISIIAGNGVSIPFGTDTWDGMTKNVLDQLQPRFINSSDSVKEFFGDITLSTNDFAKFTLSQKVEMPLYWRAIHYSVYRRYNRLAHGLDSSIKAICEAKHKYWDRISLFTYNYDTFIENQYEHDYGPSSLKPAIGVECEEARTPKTDIVVHAHGRFLETADEGEDIILTRSEYFSEYRSKAKKQLQELETTLRDNICLFVGSSMTDIFQLAMIEDNSRLYGDDHKPWIFALLQVDKWKGVEDKTLSSIYEYFLMKDVLIIGFTEFTEIPDIIRDLFSLPKI